MGHEIGRGTIAKVLKEAGVGPASERQKRTTWKEFLRTHWDLLAAADFFTVEVWTALGLVRYHVFFVIRLVLIGQSSLHRATSEFVAHYHRERNHQGLGNKIMRPEFAEFPAEGAIDCRKRLGGLLRYYYRKAA